MKSDIPGRYKVKLFGVIRCVRHTKVICNNSDGLVGHNAFFGRIRCAHFRVELGDGETAKIIYDLPVNLAPLRRLTDEIRATAPDKWTGKGIYRIGRRNVVLLKFTMEKLAA